MAQEATFDPAEAVPFAVDSDPEGRYPKEDFVVCPGYRLASLGAKPGNVVQDGVV